MEVVSTATHSSSHGNFFTMQQFRYLHTGRHLRAPPTCARPCSCWQGRAARHPHTLAPHFGQPPMTSAVAAFANPSPRTSSTCGEGECHGRPVYKAVAERATRLGSKLGVPHVAHGPRDRERGCCGHACGARTFFCSMCAAFFRRLVMWYWYGHVLHAKRISP